MKIFSKTLTENLPLKKPWNPETRTWNMVCQWKVLDNDNISYIVGKVLKMLFNDIVFENINWN